MDCLLHHSFSKFGVQNGEQANKQGFSLMTQPTFCIIFLFIPHRWILLLLDWSVHQSTLDWSSWWNVVIYTSFV